MTEQAMPRPSRIVQEIVFDGRNVADVRALVDADPRRGQGETWFFTRAQSGPTGLQAWRTVKDRSWGEDVKAALYDPYVGWRPVRKGDTILVMARGNSILGMDC